MISNYDTSSNIKLVLQGLNLTIDNVSEETTISKRTIKNFFNGLGIPDKDSLENYYSFVYLSLIRLNCDKEEIYKEEYFDPNYRFKQLLIKEKGFDYKSSNNS